MSSRRRWIQTWGVGGAAAAGLIYLAWSVWDHEAVMLWVQQAHPFPFFTLMALLPLVGVPITPFFILAGAVFGTRVGVVGSTIALGLNLVACYVFARKMQPSLSALLHRLGYELPDFGARGNGSTRFTLAVKFAPGVPAFVKNYGLALAGVDFPTYFAWSMLITGAYGISVIVLGESLFVHDRNRMLLVAAVLVALALVAWWWRRRRARREFATPV